MGPFKEHIRREPKKLPHGAKGNLEKMERNEDKRVEGFRRRADGTKGKKQMHTREGQHYIEADEKGTVRITYLSARRSEIGYKSWRCTNERTAPNRKMHRRRTRLK